MKVKLAAARLAAAKLPAFVSLRFEQFQPAPFPGRLLLFLGSLAWLWWPLGLPIVLLVPDPDWQSILALGWLYGLFVAIARRWGRRVWGKPQILQHYGLVWTGQALRELALGWLLGSLLVFLLFGIQGVLGWAQWQVPGAGLGRIVLEGLAVALGIGFAEELFFRGWFLDELERDYGGMGGLGLSSLVFAIVHFLKPWSEILRTFPQFPGLFLLGCVLVLGKRSCQGRMGLNVGIHGGLVWAYYLVVVGNLSQSLAVVPQWITGIDNNPLAGVMGLLGLGNLIVLFAQKRRHQG